MEGNKMNKLQRYITFKALRLLAELEGVELPQEVKEVADKVAEQNPYETDVTDIVSVMESMINDIKQNDAYELWSVEELAKHHIRQVSSLEELAQQLNYSEIELEISTSIDLHDSFEDLVSHLEREFNANELKEILDDETPESLENTTTEKRVLQ